VKAQELRDKGGEELAENLSEAKKRLFFEMKMKGLTGEGVKPHEMRALRRDIARMETIIREKKLATSAAAPASAEGAES
jgi:large subunit ribosomal protein L29